MRCTFLLLLVILMMPSYCLGASILIIESYHKEYPWAQNYNKGITTTVGKNHQLHHFNMDTKRLPPSKFSEMAALAWDRYLALKPDLVILADDNAISYLSGKFSVTETPVIFLGLNANPRRYGINKFDNFTGVLERPIFKRSLLLAELLLVQPSEKRILVLFDNGHTSVATIEHINQSQKTLTLGQSQIQFELVSTISQWKSLVLESKANEFDAIFIGLYHTLNDENGEHISPAEVMEWTNSHSPLPHFGFWDFSIGSKANIGGYVLDGFLHGQLAGSIVLKVLTGTRTQDIPYLHDQKGKYIFSISGLEKWGLTVPDKMKRQIIWTN